MNGKNKELNISPLLKLDANERFDIVFAGGGLKMIWAGSFVDQLIKSGMIIDNVFTTSSGATLAYAFANNAYDLFIDKSLEISAEHRLYNLKSIFKSEEKILGFQKSFKKLIAFLYESEKAKNTKIIYNCFKLNHPILFYKHVKEIEKKLSYFKRNEVDFNMKFNKSLILNEKIVNNFSINNYSDFENSLLATSGIPPFISANKNFKKHYDGGLLSPLPLHLALKKEYNSNKKILLIANNFQTIRLALSSAEFVSRNCSGNTFNSIRDKNIFYLIPTQKISVSMWGYTEKDLIIKDHQMGVDLFNKFTIR